jgi:hypothetical protein
VLRALPAAHRPSWELGGPTTSQLATGQGSAFQSTMGSYEGAFSAEPAAGGWGPSTGGLGSWGGQGTGKPVVGSPTNPVMPDLIVLWEMTPLRREVRAGARLWVRGPARRGWVATGPKPKPGGAGGWAPGIRARFWGRRGGQPGYLFKHLNYWG